MRIFVTGATGWVGSAVVDELIAAGHAIIGLSRSDIGAAALTAAGAEVQRGSLEDLDSLRRGATAADAVIHTAFDHDFSKFAASSAADRQAIETLGAVLEGSDRPLLVTSGIAFLTSGRAATEEDAVPPVSPSYPRASEAAAASVAAQGVRVGVVRLPPSVHGEGDHGFVPTLIAIAREKGVSVYPGDGSNRWAAVHRRDAARVYRLAIENGVTASRYHAVAEDGVAFEDIAEMIGRHLNVPIVGKPADEVAEHFGGFAMFASMDVPASSAATRALLGWRPEQLGLLADLDRPSYFA